MSILVLGGAGMAGHVIALFLQERGYNVTCLTRQRIGFCKYIEKNIEDLASLRGIVLNGEIDVVVNAIGILNDAAEKEKAKAVLINSYLPHYLAAITENARVKIIHLSTDCVFSGSRGSYSEDSFPDERSFYGRTKSLGELSDNNNLTFRTSIIGPDLRKHGIGLFNWFMLQQKPIHGYTNAIWTGVTTVTLARAIERAIREDLRGLYHLVNNAKISKYELLNMFNSLFRDKTISIIPDEDISYDKSLINSREDFSFVVPGYQNMLEEMWQWVEDHRVLYPHYKYNN